MSERVTTTTTNHHQSVLHPPTLQSDTVVFQHAKLPSRESDNTSPKCVVTAKQYATASRSPLITVGRGASQETRPSALINQQQHQRLHVTDRDVQREYRDQLISTQQHQHYGQSTPEQLHHQDTIDEYDRNLQQHSTGIVLQHNSIHTRPIHEEENRVHDASNISWVNNRMNATRQPTPLTVEQHEDKNTGRIDSDGMTGSSFTNLLQDAVETPSAIEIVNPQGRQIISSSYAPSNTNEACKTERLKVTVMKESDKLGFGIRQYREGLYKVSTVQGASTAAKSSLRIGDSLLSVNSVDLTRLSFLEVIQQLKATKTGPLVLEVERETNRNSLSLAQKTSSHLSKQRNPSQGKPTAAVSFMSVKRQLPVDQPAASPQSAPSKHDTIQPGLVNPQVSVNPSDRLSANTLPASIDPGEYPPRKRPRARPTSTPNAALEKTLKQELNAVMLELKKERTEKKSLEAKNLALRKRLQQMLIDNDEVRVKANAEVIAVKESSKRDLDEMERKLATARAQLRLQNRAPDIVRTDSIINDLTMCKAQLDRLRKAESDRAAQLSAQFTVDNRLANREAHRVHEKLVTMFRSELRLVGKRTSHPTVTVIYDGIRRLAFLKLFGLPHDFDRFTAPEFYSMTPIQHKLEQEDMLNLFGNSLSHEERTGLFIVATAPMNITYDPPTERLHLVCLWTEQNALRELARNFRF